MRHLAFLVSTFVVGSTGLATADSFGGWLYSAPPGYVATQWDDHVELTKHGPSSFCAIELFEVRPRASSLAVEAAYEWHNVVTPNFSTKVTRRAKLTSTSDTEIAATTAILTTRDGTRYAGIHYVVMPPGMIGSALLLSTSPQALRDCERVGTRLVRALELDWGSPQLTDPEARVESPQGRWAMSATIGATTNREYIFAANGSYRFHSETLGKVRDRVVDELGTYSLRGNRLTLTPRTSTAVTIASGVATQRSLPLEPATYVWTTRYDPETDAWSLVLTPHKPIGSNGVTPPAASSYSNRDAPAWKYAPPGPAS